MHVMFTLYVVCSFEIVTLFTFQIIIEGVRGKDYKGDISIDDITVKDGGCDGSTGGGGAGEIMFFSACIIYSFRMYYKFYDYLFYFF